MLVHDRRSRTRPRRQTRPRPGLWTETLEARQLLVATPINVASGYTIASGLPLPGLAAGQGLATTAQALGGAAANNAATAAVTVAPASVAAPAGPDSSNPTSTGPATTLAPLMNDAETANAAASESARPRPGQSDRISIILAVPETLPIPDLRLPGLTEVVPGPEIQSREIDLDPAPAPKPTPPALTLPPAIPAGTVVPMTPPPLPEVPLPDRAEPISFAAWDAALDLLAAESPEESPAATPVTTAEATLAAGVLVAAWTGWKRHPTGRSRRRARPLAAIRTQG